ncbi:hypothetical protein, partial [uncultured Leifsonia sp.]|uniref:hypothetical protein n=1 Tax=uncultured Leifsonia sp. TaxID=340359 RepID=UPI0025E20CC9
AGGNGNSGAARGANHGNVAAAHGGTHGNGGSARGGAPRTGLRVGDLVSGSTSRGRGTRRARG